MKQIVGGTISNNDPGALRTNFVSEHSSAWYAQLYARDHLTGGHVIMLGPGNEQAAREALATFPGGMQVGGGVTAENAANWITAGASHVIVTSWLFREGELDRGRLAELVGAVGRARLVIDLSCRKRDGRYWVVTDRWQRFTQMEVNKATLADLASSCAEFLVHAVDVEGLCRGVDFELARALAEWSPIECTYAGGANSLRDLEEITRVSGNRVHLTIGSALDIFGGTGVKYEELVRFNQKMGKG